MEMRPPTEEEGGVGRSELVEADEAEETETERERPRGPPIGMGFERWTSFDILLVDEDMVLVLGEERKRWAGRDLIYRWRDSITCEQFR